MNDIREMVHMEREKMSHLEIRGHFKDFFRGLEKMLRRKMTAVVTSCFLGMNSVMF
jgi:hypothetical protein